MEQNLDEIAKSLFSQIRSQIPKVKMEDAEGNATIEPEQARFFEFNYIVDGSVFGLVNIDISTEDGVVVVFPNDITQGQNQYNKKKWFNFLKEIRECARQHMADFNVRDISKQTLDKRDKEFMSSKKETSMSESKLFGTSKTSYQDLGNSKIIVKHSAPVNYNHPAGRTQRIESIYIENSQGERFRYPLRHLNGARALAQHIGEGGNPYDSIGQYVISLSEELSKLRFFKGYVDRSPTISEAMGTVHTRVVERIDQIKKEINQLQHSGYYKTFAESFIENNAKEIPEELMNDWIDRLTIRTFNEELKGVFPYIYKLVDESELPVRELDISEIIEDNLDIEQESVDNSEIPELESYLSYINSIQTEEEQQDANQVGMESLPTTITPEASQVIIDQLNQGVSIADMLSGETSGIPEEALEGLRSIVTDMALDMEMLDEKELTDIGEKVAEKLYQISQSAPAAAPAPAPAPAAEPAPTEPAAAPAAAAPAMPPEQPAMAEGDDNDPPFEPNVKKSNKDQFGNVIKHRAKHLAKQGMRAAIEKAKKAGATAETIVNFGQGDLSLGEAIRLAGFNVESFFNRDSDNNSNNEIVEYIKSMFDATTGKFPKGETGVLISVEKKFGEGSVKTAQHIIGELSMMAETNRLRHLAGMR
jgi:hypothetical protein